MLLQKNPTKIHGLPLPLIKLFQEWKDIQKDILSNDTQKDILYKKGIS